MIKDTSKLPRWAQQEIEMLQGNVEYWKKKALVGPGDSDTFVHRYPEEQPLGRGEVIRFVLNEQPEQYIEVTNESDHVSIRARDSLIAQPWSSNVIHIWTEK